MKPVHGRVGVIQQDATHGPSREVRRAGQRERVADAAGVVGAAGAAPQGIFLYQFETLCRNRLGYDRGEFSWVLEDNVLLRRSLERFGAHVYKTYRIFEKPL